MRTSARPKSAAVVRPPEIRQYFKNLRSKSPEYELKLYPAPIPKKAKDKPRSKKDAMQERILSAKAQIHQEKEEYDLLKVELAKTKQRIKEAGSPLARSEKTKLKEAIGVLHYRIRKAKTAKKMLSCNSESDLHLRCDFASVMCAACTKLQQAQRHIETHPTIQAIRRKVAMTQGEISRCRETTQQQEQEIMRLKAELERVPKLGALKLKHRAAKKELRRLQGEMEHKLEVQKLLSSSWPGPEVVAEAPVVYEEPKQDISLALHTLETWDQAPGIVVRQLQLTQAENQTLAKQIAKRKTELSRKRADILSMEVGRRMGLLTTQWIEELEAELEAFRREEVMKKEDLVVGILEEKRRLHEERAMVRSEIRRLQLDS